MGRRSQEMISQWNYDACVAGIVGALGQAASDRM
jgi:hypothetical protein